MQITLIACVKIAHLEKFRKEHFCPTDNFFQLLVEGRYTVTSDSGTVTVNPGEGMLFRKGKVYERHVIEPITIFLFRYTADVPVFAIEHIRFKDTARLNSTIAMLEHYDRFPRTFIGDAQNHLFHDLIHHYRFEYDSAFLPPKMEDSVISESIACMAHRIHLKNPVSWYAKKSHLSYVQFYRRFKAVVGITPKEYLLKLRVDKAKYLLLEQSTGIREIAYACGFENEYYFSNFFKNAVGVSPSDFRRNGNITTRQTGGLHST